MSESLISMIPLIVMIAVIYMFVRAARKRKPAAIVDPAALVIPEYTGFFAFFRRHWHGDYSLPRSYWVHTFLLQLVGVGIMLALLAAIGQSVKARYASTAFLVCYAGLLLLWIWSVVGTWASSSKHASRGGSSTWANLAKVAIILGALRMVSDTVEVGPILKEHWQVASGRQFGAPTTLQVRADGKSILLAGGINDGSAEQLEQALQLAPGVTTVVFASGGGWIREGQLLADVIRRHRLNTYVERRCESACTIAFLAGVDRAADPAAKIGFHSSRFIGANGGAEEAKDLRQIYATTGLPQAFIDKVLATPNAEMWYPSHDTLQQAGVLTRRSLGGETATLATSVHGRDDLERELLKSELLAGFAKRDPAKFKAMIDAAWNSLGRGATDAQFMMAVRQQLLPTLIGYLPAASDATLVEYQNLMVRQLKALAAVDPEACVELSFPTGQYMKVASRMPRELREQEVALLTRVVREADDARRLQPTEDQVSQVAVISLRQMPTSQVDIMAAGPVRLKSPPTAICAAAIAYFEGFQSIPEQKRGFALRVLYSGK